MSTERAERPLIDFAALARPVAAELLGEPNKRLSTRTELRFGTRGSVAIDLETGTFYDFEAEVGGGVADLIRHITGQAPVEWLRANGYVDDTDKPVRTHQPPTSTQTQRTSTYGLELWAAAAWGTVADHPYAINKGIIWDAGAARGQASGRIIGKDSDCIIIPIRDLETGRVRAVQCINAVGAKQTFGPLKGNGLLLGNTLDTRPPWYVAEGWASAVSMVFHHLHGNGVCAVAFGKSNLETVAHRLDQLYTLREIVILREQD